MTLCWTFIFVLWAIIAARGQTNGTIEKIFCGSSISDTVPRDGEQKYVFMLSDDKWVNFATCNSIGDVSINIYNEDDYDIVGGYCYGFGFFGSLCGECDNGNFQENFDIPLMIAGMYIIQITPWGPTTSVSYQLDITCSTNTTANILKCGKSLSGNLESPSDIDYAYLNLTSVTDIISLDSSASNFSAYLYFHDYQRNVLYQAYRYINVTNVWPGLYPIKLESGYGQHGDWYLSVQCYKAKDHTIGKVHVLGCDESVTVANGQRIDFNLSFETEWIVIEAHPGHSITDISFFNIWAGKIELGYTEAWTEPLSFPFYNSYQFTMLYFEYIMKPGWYELYIDGTETEYNVSASCNNIKELNEMEPLYILYMHQFSNVVGWYESEEWCESMLDTTLATVSSEQEMNTARDIIKYSGWEPLIDKVWIGLYRNIVLNNSQWQWTDGTPCNYNDSHTLSNDTVVMNGYFDRNKELQIDTNSCNKESGWHDIAPRFLCNRMLLH